ncbi:UNVERIFIED_CONTAM: hypothetical protein GTU68_016080 [Idotea baltica]|nr:hypothetical protein [Idotea baltica]
MRLNKSIKVYQL